jgi:hypothetical protein
MFCFILLIIILNNNPLGLGSRQVLSTVILIWCEKKENYTNVYAICETFMTFAFHAHDAW